MTIAFRPTTFQTHTYLHEAYFVTTVAWGYLLADCFASKKREKKQVKHKKRDTQASLLCHFLAVVILKLRSTWADADGFGRGLANASFSDSEVRSPARKQIRTFLLQLKTPLYKQTSPLNLTPQNENI
jgi:hypothetical protein